MKFGDDYRDALRWVTYREIREPIRKDVSRGLSEWKNLYDLCVALMNTDGQGGHW